MNLNRRWWGASAVRVRVLAVALALVAAGCMVLGWGSHAGRAKAALSSAGSADFLAQSAALAIPGSRQLRDAKHMAPAQARALLAGLPLIFEPNQGQANLDANDPRARFIARGSGYSLFLGSEGAILGLQSRTQNSSRTEFLEMKLAGASPHAAITAAEPLAGKSNYLLGNDPAAWRRGIPQFARVRYENLYPGINLVFYGNQGRLEYDFQVAPGADPSQAELEFNGAQHLQVEDGALVIQGKGGNLRFEAPHIYQKIDGCELAVAGGFVLRGAHRAGFAVGPYDRSRELVIDPQLVYTTYFGGSGNELATSVAVLSPFIYITGSTTTSPTSTTPLPITSGVYQSTLNGTQNIYVAVINPSNPVASQLVYVTYLGGNGVDSPVGIGVDGGGNAYVAGTTSSTNFPTSTDAYQTSVYSPQSPGAATCSLGSTGPQHVFASVLNSTLSTLNYSTYLSGNGNDCASGMTIDAGGHLFVTGTTTSTNASSTTIQFPASSLPFAQPFQAQSFDASGQFFVTEISTQNAVGPGSIFYSTYFGGGASFTNPPVVTGGQIAVDKNENIYFTGTTNFVYTGGQVADFPILNAYQPCLDQPPPTIIINPPTCTNSASTSSLPDAFVAKLNPAAPSQLQFSTYLGGSQTDSGTGIALDTSGNVYITGTTNSPDFVAATSIISFAPFQQCLNNEYMSTSGTTTCTETTSTCTAGTPCNYPNDAFVAKLSAPASGSSTPNVQLTYFSYLGGMQNEAGNAITVDTGEGAVLTGSTQSTASVTAGDGGFPATGCGEIECNLVGTQDAFIARINTETQDNQQNPAASWATYFGSGTPSTAMTEGTSITLDPSENIYVAGDTNSASGLIGSSGGFQPANAGGYDAFVTELKPDSVITIYGILSLGNNETYVSAGNQATFIYTVTNTGPDIAPVLTISDFLNQTGVVMVPNSISVTGGLCNTVNSNSTLLSCTVNSLQAGATATVTVVLTPTQNQQGQSQTFNGGTVSVTGQNIPPVSTVVFGNMSDYSIVANPSNVSVQAGNTASYQVQLTPSPIYSSNISLSYSLQATGTSCTFTFPTVTLNGSSPGSSTLNCVTTPRPVIPTARAVWTRQFYAIWLSLPGLALLGLGAGGKSRRRAAGMMLGLILAMVVFLPACSQPATQPPATGTPAGSYSLTVTATSGTDVKNYSVTLTVT